MDSFNSWIHPFPESRQGDFDLDPLERFLVIQNDRLKKDSELQQKFKHNLTEQIEFWIKEFEANRSENLGKIGRFVLSFEKLCQFIYTFINLSSACFITGVSNTRAAGRMWPARCVSAARDIIKITQNNAKTTVFSSFSLQLWPAETFFLFMRPASLFNVKMWPAYETEFETPA